MKKVVLLIFVMMVMLQGCGVSCPDSYQAPEKTGIASDVETVSDVKEPADIFEAGLEVFRTNAKDDEERCEEVEQWLAVNFGEYLVNYSYLDLYTSKEIIYIAVFPEGGERCVDGYREGNNSCIQQWNSFKQNIMESSNSIAESFGYGCMIDVVNENNNHMSFIRALNGEAVYDEVTNE